MNSSMRIATSGEPRICGRSGVVAAEQRDHDHDEGDGERHVGDRGEALAPELLGAGMGRAEAAHAPERGAHVSDGHQRGPPMNR